MSRLPKKLDDCRHHGLGSELFIVEGDSAARTVNAVRCTTTQAVLPMQGKPMNAIKARRADVMAHPKFADVLGSLGIEAGERNGRLAQRGNFAPATPSTNRNLDSTDAHDGFSFNPSNLRYEQIVLLFDPDADGIHARTLMHLFFYRWLRPLLEAGRVVDAYPPLWQIDSPELVEPIFAYTQSHYERVSTALRDQNIQASTRRFRGLGNIPTATLIPLCVDRATRKVTPVGVATAENALAIFAELRDFGRSM